MYYQCKTFALEMFLIYNNGSITFLPNAVLQLFSLFSNVQVDLPVGSTTSRLTKVTSSNTYGKVEKNKVMY